MLNLQRLDGLDGVLGSTEDSGAQDVLVDALEKVLSGLNL